MILVKYCRVTNGMEASVVAVDDGQWTVVIEPYYYYYHHS